MLETLYLHLSGHDVLSDEERSLLADTIVNQREFTEGEDLVSEGSRPSFRAG
ncbi:Transcriptional regulator, Crp/Fnr family (fragment) [Mesorhizobium plurifarium]|uniref:Transcriptional regulator, Crp/Fnr family n=1 Tax=Mesorhizobium plurifarium TaxID=69974 RepID=A0A090G491_MESPL